MLALFARFRCFFIIYYAPFARRCSVNCFSALTEIGCVSLARILCCRDNEKYRKPCKSNTKLCWASASSQRCDQKRAFHGFASRSEVISHICVSGREHFSSLIRRPFSPKHEATNQQDRPTRAVFSCPPAPRTETIGNLDVEATLYTSI